jgi:hypothetical protein
VSQTGIVKQFSRDFGDAVRSLRPPTGREMTTPEQTQ